MKSEAEIQEEILEYFVSGARLVLFEFLMNSSHQSKIEFNLNSYEEILKKCLNEYQVNTTLDFNKQIDNFREFLKKSENFKQVLAQEKKLFIIGLVINNYINNSVSYSLAKIYQNPKQSKFKNNLTLKINSLINMNHIARIQSIPKIPDYYVKLKYLKDLINYSNLFQNPTERTINLEKNDIDIINVAMQKVLKRLGAKTSGSIYEKYILLRNIQNEFAQTEDPNTQMLCLELFIKTASSHRNLDENNTNRFFSAKSETTSIKLFRKSLEGKLSPGLSDFVNSQITEKLTQNLGHGN